MAIVTTGATNPNLTKPLGKRGQVRLGTLENRAARGTIKPGAMQRLENLRARAGIQSPPPGGEAVTGPAGSGDIAGTGTVSGPSYDTTKQGANDFSRKVFESGTGKLPGVVDSAFEAIDFSSLPGVMDTGQLANERQRIEEQEYGRLTRGYDQQKARDKAAFDQQMAERGIQPGSGELYSRAAQDFERSWNDRYDNARMSATGLGGQELQRMFDIGEAGRAGRLGEQITQRQLPLSQLGGLMGLGAQSGQLALNYQDLANRMKIARMQNANRGGGGGGGGGSVDDFGLPSIPPGLVG